MARSKSSTRSRLTQQARQRGAELAQLRRAGLTKAKPGKDGRLGGSAYRTLAKFKDVLAGKAKVVKAPKAVRERYKELPAARGKIAVPVRRGERVRVLKSGEIARYPTYPSRAGGRRKVVMHVFLPRNIPLDQIPRGPRINYRIHFAHSVQRIRRYDDLIDFISLYRPRTNFPMDLIEYGNFYEDWEDGEDEDDEAA